MGFWVFLIHSTLVSVLLSASFERCFVSRMRDFFSMLFTIFTVFNNFYFCRFLPFLKTISTIFHIFHNFHWFSPYFTNLNSFAPFFLVFHSFNSFSLFFIIFHRFSQLFTISNRFSLLPIKTVLNLKKKLFSTFKKKYFQLFSLFSTVLHWCYYPQTPRDSVPSV